MKDIPARMPATNPRSRQLPAFVQRTLAGARSRRVPYRLGDVVIGEDLFNGRKEGVVVAKDGPLVGLQSAGRTLFYDYRQLWRAD